jgi:urocanate reductase
VRFSPEEIEEPGIRFEDTMFLLNTLAKYEPDYFHISGSYFAKVFSKNIVSSKRMPGSSISSGENRYPIINQEDTEPLINKYHKMQSAQLAQIPLIGVGSIAQRKDASSFFEILSVH